MMSEPNWIISSAWILQQNRLLRYGPTHPARYWNLDKIFQQGYWKYGVHYNHFHFKQDIAENFLKIGLASTVIKN
jgi:hypothetical protein